ncbi:alanine racemase [Paeniglutamicibacter cryotolerans]|uniref:D-serine deaminase-like pyridoxal phosphate-dependent protein n=1 Tax=Paeniglutamicibacter cryotolerans TaxID=670079 RepID=A0A839QLS4_9MICC|nr:alanine racemase [Paeniglutamicibacter cryotolerans]MBB2995555.1 D-serine deaminase-like pyridoxal phosphate-dependent protein [Paeniglutamicibacter cryotolerans]
MSIPPGSLPLDSLPRLLLDVEAIEANIALKERWAAEHGMVLAPHIKTTMTRQIVQRQLPGAWGATVATAKQAALAAQFGARKILIANEVIFAPDLMVLRGLQEADPGLLIHLLVDSAAGIAAATGAFAGSPMPLRVLIDVGVAGGRTGIRDAAQAGPLAEAVIAAPCLLFAGVSAYEGVAPNSRDAGNLAAIDAHCANALGIFEMLRSSVEIEKPIFSIGGSAFQDRAALFLPGGTVENVLRSGCYVVHDHGTYANISPVKGLTAAARVRAQVISAPEEGRVMINAGKRELAYDAGLPVLLVAYRAGAPIAGAAGTATRLFDHHLILEECAGLVVGDLVDLGISHPCSVFDRWRDAVAVSAQGAETWHPEF